MLRSLTKMRKEKNSCSVEEKGGGGPFMPALKYNTPAQVLEESGLLSFFQHVDVIIFRA